MHRPRIAIDRHLVGAVDKFVDPLAIGYADRIFCQRRGNCDVVDFLETASPLTFQRAGAGNKNDRRPFAPGLHHRRHRIGKTLGAYKTHRRFAGDSCVAVSEMAGNLLMRAVDHLHLRFHKAFQRRIAEPAGKGEYMLDALLLKRPRK